MTCFGKQVGRCWQQQWMLLTLMLCACAAQGRFGTTGKFKVEFAPPLQAAAADGEKQLRSAEDNVLHLWYKRLLFDPDPKQKLRQ